MSMDLLVVGLDGLSFNMLDRFDVTTPFLSSLREEGVSGDLMSVDTPTTIPAWTSFATGKDPGSHGTTNMITQERNYSTSPSKPNTTDAAIYDFLDDAIFVNLPASNGRIPAGEGTHLVSAMLAKNKSEAVPDELKSLESYEDYILSHDVSLKVRPAKYLQHVLDIVDARHRFAREAFESFDPRVGFVLFSATDWAGHILGNLSSERKQREFYQQIVSRTDERADDLADLADNVVVVSDHGFEHKRTNIHLNEWLSEREYFVEQAGTKKAADVAVSVAKSVANRSDRLYSLIRRVHNHIMGTEVGEALHSAANPDVDHSQSLCWQLRYGCLYINDDRFEHPTVTDPDALRAELITELANLETEDGTKLFRDVLSAEEAYADPGEMAPDVIARPNQHHFPTTLWSPTGGYSSRTDNFEHRYRGVFVADGPGFTSGSVDGLSIVDVLPTILALLGEQLSPKFDGRPAIDVLARSELPPERPTSEIPSPLLDEALSVSDETREGIVEDRLEGLGYLE